MEHRKIQLTGGSSFTVSLPREWIEAQKLKKGDSVLLDIKEDGTLSILGDESKGEKRKADILICEEESLTERTFITRYLQGYSTIRLFAENTVIPEKRKKIVETAEYLIGIELFEESAQEMVFTTLVDFGSTDIHKLMRRISLLVSFMYGDAMKSLSSPDPELHSSISARDRDVDKLHFFIMREVSEAFRDASVARRLGLERIYDGVYFLIAAKNLERIADYAVSISGNAATAKKIPQNLTGYAVKAKELFEESTRRLFDRTPEECNRLLAKLERLKEKKEDVFSEMTTREEKREILAHFNIIDGIEGTIRHSSNIVEAALNLSI